MGMALQEDRVRLFKHLDWEIRDKQVISAMKKVPREKFVPPEYYNFAYDDRPLSIGFGQTISQPFIVALMIQALELKGDEKVLEVGTGSGYVAAILAELSNKVITVECIPELVNSASLLLKNLGYHNIEVHLSNDTLGWLNEAPYDAIIVSAGAPSIPRILFGQLSWGGRLVIPVGSRWEQKLLKVSRNKEGEVIEDLGACYFVPLINKDAWEA
jgi:protein-L-isoaspartate(D-aspartate) O-methyltransferase